MGLRRTSTSTACVSLSDVTLVLKTSTSAIQETNWENRVESIHINITQRGNKRIAENERKPEYEQGSEVGHDGSLELDRTRTSPRAVPGGPEELPVPVFHSCSMHALSAQQALTLQLSPNNARMVNNPHHSHSHPS